MDERRRVMNSSDDSGGIRVGTVFNFAYKNNSLQEITLPRGSYNLQVWGAQGGSVPNYTGSVFSFSARSGGKGGYSEGILSLRKEKTLYVYIGGSGNSGSICSNTTHDNHYYWMTASGGNATDIRTSNASIDSTESNKSRFIVAGGGGGAANGVYLVPGDGSGTKTYNNSGNPYGGGYSGGGDNPGKINQAGTGGYFSSYGAAGAGTREIGSGGRGGGWWRSGSVNDGKISSVSKNGGGSGFVNTAKNAQYRPEGYTGLELDSGQTIDGNHSFPNTSGTANETGHEGNGYAKITVLSLLTGPIDLYDDELGYSESSVTITDQSQSLPALVNTENLPLTFSSSDTSVATIDSSGNVTILTTGTTTISASFAGNSEWKAKTVSYTLIRQARNVEDTELYFTDTSVTTDSAEDLPTLVNTLNLPVTYTSSDTLVATVNSSGVVTILSGGTTTISAVYSGNNAFYNAKTVSYSLTVDMSGIYEYSYSGTTIQKTLDAGTYCIECWGAQGGSIPSDTTVAGGKGGYSIGYLTLAQAVTAYITVGGQGTGDATKGSSTGSNAGGFNGGGNGYSRTKISCSGGGASDVRLLQDSLYSRLIVAGGGGGTGEYSSSNHLAGGYGGGTTGGNGSQANSYTNAGTGGTQSSGGISYRLTTADSSTYGTTANFGTGGSALSNSYDIVGGGGGWYGGGYSYEAGAGGGSGYVYNADTASNYPSGCLLNSAYYLSDAQTTDGGNQFPSVSGGTETGHEGNGHVRIMKVYTLTLHFETADGQPLTGNQITITSTAMNRTATTDSNGDVVFTVPNGTYTVECDGYTTDKSTVTVSGNTSENFEAIPPISNYSYTGSVQTDTLEPGTYKIEVWGAQGGSYDDTYIGGKGGYSVGKLTLSQATTVYIVVGGQGTGGTSSGAKDGGYNGGGGGYSTNTTYIECGGGGASDVRIGADSLYSRVIVAGGGGGAGSYNASNRYAGGAGGGISGRTPSQYNTSYRAGTGGSQTARGISYYGNTANSTTYGTLAAFGVGAGAKSGTTSYQITGGGGGWYGGGYSRRGAGGGGSGYVYTEDTAANYPSGCLLNSSHYLADASTVDGGSLMPSVDGSTETGHEGNGYVRITRIA